MGSRVQGFGLLAAVLLAAGFWVSDPTPGSAATVCPPVTIEDLFPPEPETTEPEATQTTQPEETQATQPEGTDTTQPEATQTTEPEEAPEPEPPCDTPFVYPMVYPILGGGDWISGFGAPRDSGRRHHLGNDIAAIKLQPVVAVANGTVTRIGGDEGISGVRLHLRHDDGWSSLYIHLNNDTFLTDDGNGTGVRPDLAEGDRVKRGEVIGWVGDSGNAEETVPHVHFELRDPSGTPVDPATSLEAATHTSPSFSGPFSDSEEESALALLLSRGVPVLCDASTARGCSSEPATASAVADWLDALVGEVELTPKLSATGSVADCAGECRQALAGGECGDDECPEPVITEAEVARALAWDRLRDAHEIGDAWLNLAEPETDWPTPPPDPPPAHPYELSLTRAFTILGGGDRCLNPPNPERELTRAEAADRIVLYLGWSEVAHCSTNSAKR